MKLGKVVGLLLVLLAFGLSACAGRPAPADIANLDYGAYPPDLDSDIEAAIRSYLKDPFSAVVTKISGPKQMWARVYDGLIGGYGYCYTVNGKNSFGAYTGAKAVWVLVKDERIIHSLGLSDDYNSLAKTNCANM